VLLLLLLQVETCATITVPKPYASWHAFLPGVSPQGCAHLLLLLLFLLLQVETCATITITLSNYALSPVPAGMPSTLTSTHKVCWFRHDGQASANMDFQSCADPTGCEYCTGYDHYIRLFGRVELLVCVTCTWCGTVLRGLVKQLGGAESAGTDTTPAGRIVRKDGPPELRGPHWL
jgi:hypothetical protein